MPRKERIRGLLASDPESAKTEDRPSEDLIVPTRVVSVDSTKLTLIQESSYASAADFTTTDTTNWQNLASFGISVPSGNHSIAVFSVANFSHSAGPAEVSFDLLLTWDDAGANSYQLAQVQNYYLPTANKKAFISMNVMYNIPTNLPSVLPGKRTVYFRCFNHTAGTLTIHSNGLIRGVFGFISGDST